MKLRIRYGLCLIALTMPHLLQTSPSNQPGFTLTLNDTPNGQTRGLIKDTQTALANLPQTISSMLPTVNNIQKLLLSASLIGLGYQSCKYGLSKFNTASKLYNKSDDSEKGKKRYSQSKWYALAGSSFLMAGACLLWHAQRIANLAYSQQ